MVALWCRGLPPSRGSYRAGAGPVVPLWVSLGVADWLVKLALAMIALVPFRLIVARATGHTAPA